MPAQIQITFDCSDADAQAKFWAEVLGYIEQPPPAGFITWEEFLTANNMPIPPAGEIGAVVDPDDVGPRLLFLRVPEGKAGKNRVHLDVIVGDKREARVTQLVAIGATHVRDVTENDATWSVLLDPEGNEFCLI